MEDDAAEETVNVCVAVRCRPMSGKELAEGASVGVEFAEGTQVSVWNKKERTNYAFDHVFQPELSQESIFQALGVPLLDKSFDGYNSTIFAYGQTGSGKTHTMMAHRAGPEDRGLIPRISDGLYERIDKVVAEYETRRFLVTCSFLEIYNEVIYDLLVPRNKQSRGGLEVREQKGLGVYVKDLTEMVVESSEGLNRLIEGGFDHRSTAATKMNDASSRSHCIFIIKLHQKDASDEAKNTFSKLNLVDLAGSERAKSTEAEGDRLKEGANINKSLSALGNVINALSSMASGNKKIFVPYRNSKLTRVLQESLGGNSLCTMVATISPSNTNVEETLSTLNYAKRAKTIKVTATKNDEASQIKKLEQEVEALRQKLATQGAAAAGSLNSSEKQELETKYEGQIEELQSFMKQSWEEKQRLSEQHAAEQKRIMEEAERAAKKVREERKRRLALLEQNGDMQLSLQAIQGLGGRVTSGWPDKIQEAIKVEQQMRAQLRAVKLFRESAGGDFSMCIGCKVNDAVAILTLLGQVHAKLQHMAKELGSLARIETQFEEMIGQITPAVALALREAQAGVGTESAKDDEAKEELVDMLTLVQKQLAKFHAKTRSFAQSERTSLCFTEELRWLLMCLKEDGAEASNSRVDLVKGLQDQAEGAAAATSDGGGDKCATQELPVVLGLSTFELPDERIGASSNEELAKSARLLQAVAYGGWAPANDALEEYLEINLGEERTVSAISMQGRIPCSQEWQQTRDLLHFALEGISDKLPTAEKIYRRPPVRLLHDVGVALAHDRGCFTAPADGGWDIPEELLNYGELSREQKVLFFEELINRTNKAWSDSLAGGLAPLTVTPQDILSGKNCEESNRFLQLLAYKSLVLAAGKAAEAGLGDVAPHWAKAWKLSYANKAGDWQWLGGGDQAGATVLEGCADEASVKFVTLPEAIPASRLRIHPVEWHRHAGMRVEVHVSREGTKGRPSSAKPALVATSKSLETGVDLACKGIVEVKKGIEERRDARQKQEEAARAEVADARNKAEQDRDRLEQQLKDAQERVEELEAARTRFESRAVEAETSLLEAQVERDRLGTEKDQLEKDLAARTTGKDEAEKLCENLSEECTDLKGVVDDLSGQLQVMTEERDLARTKEEELFELITMKDEDLMDTNNGYVYLTERLQEKEEEMEQIQEQLQNAQAGNERLDDRSRELQDEVWKLREETTRLKSKLEEAERGQRAAQDRYMRMLKDMAVSMPCA